jgi:predicted nucleotidyltransferase
VAYTKDEAVRIAGAFVAQARTRHPVVRAYVFGSYATGRQQDHSDIDLAVVLGRGPGPGEGHGDESFEIYHEAQEFNSMLETICFREDEFEENGHSIIAWIKREGVAVTAA